MEQIRYLSKEWMTKLFGDTKQVQQMMFAGHTLKIAESGLFPYEMKYDACDIETRSEIQIPSGIMVHGILVQDGLPVHVFIT